MVGAVFEEALRDLKRVVRWDLRMYGAVVLASMVKYLGENALSAKIEINTRLNESEAP